MAEKLNRFFGNVKKRLREIKPKDVAEFTAKEGIGLIPIAGPIIKDALDEFSPDEKLEVLSELKNISETNFIEISNEIGVSVEYLRDIRTLAYYKFEILEADHEEIKQLLQRLIENQTKFEIGYQKGEIIYNVAGDLVIQNPITNEPVYIPTIQSVLRKGEPSEGDFFKKEPEWVDYEKGFIVERKEVDEIINNLENDKIQLVLGNPASGKSICLKNVGYNLANEDKNVYVIELKKHPRDEIKLFFDYIPKIDDDNPIFIVDDAHLYLSDCERLIRNFNIRGNGKLIIGSRQTKEIIEGYPTESSELEHLSKTAIKIQAEDVTEGMIQTFLEKQYQFDEERIITVSENLGKYKKDLWYLSWALKVYDSDNDSVEEDKIYKNIKKRIEKVNGEDVFLPLSIFYRYEIPIERKFLLKQLGIEESIIKNLIKLQEIEEIEKIRKPVMLYLLHSSIADLYFSAYQSYPDFGIDIKEKILKGGDKEKLEYCSFYRYITITNSTNAIDIVNYLENDWIHNRGGITLLNKLLDEDEILESIEKGIKIEEDLEKIGSCVATISWGRVKAGLRLIDSVSERIVKEVDLEKISECISTIEETNKEVSMKLVKSIDVNALSSIMEKEKDLEKIANFILAISSYGNYIQNDDELTVFDESGIEKIAFKLIDNNSSKIKQMDVKDIIHFMHFFDENGYSFKFVTSFIDTIISKMETQEELSHILDLLGKIIHPTGLDEANEFDAVIIEVQSTFINGFSKKINEEENIERIGWIINTIGEFGDVERPNEIELELVSKIDIIELSRKIEREKNIENIRDLIISLIPNEKFTINLVCEDSFISRIEAEQDLQKIGNFLNDIDYEIELVSEIVNRLNPKLKQELHELHYI